MSDKLYRILVIVLLAGILGVQIFAAVSPPRPTEECLIALDDAASAATTARGMIDAADELYQSEVYERAENINQQLFLSNEQIFFLLTHLGDLEHASLRVQVTCR